MVHNGILDVAYTLNSFAGSIPESWQAYKALVRHWFPGATCLLNMRSIAGRYQQQQPQLLREQAMLAYARVS